MKRYSKYTLVLTLVLCFTMLLSACGPAGPSGAKNNGNSSSSSNEGGKTIRDTLVMANGSTMDDFDPTGVRSAANMYGHYLTHMTLVEIDGNTKEAVGYLAESYEFDEAASAYVFHLREDAVFSDGTPVTSADVEFTFQRAQQNPVAAPQLAAMTGMNVIDEHTIALEVKVPSIEFMYNLAMANFSILSKAACEADPDNGYRIGCGPYTQIDWDPDNYTLYQRVEDYWNGTSPTKYLKYLKIAEPSARAIALQTGEVDIDMALAPAEVTTIEEDSNCDVVKTEGSVLHYMFFNVAGQSANEALKDARVRKAIAYAINCDDIINGAREGYGVKTGALPNASISYADYDYTIFQQDVEKAKSLLAEAGYPDGFKMTIHHNSISHGMVVEIIQNQLSQIGIELSIACADRSQMYSDFATGMGYESGILNMQFNNTPGSLGQAVYGTGQVANYTNSGSAKVDQLLLDILTANTMEDRERASYELNEAMAEECLFIPLFTADSIYGIRNNVKELGLYDGSMYIVFRNAYVVD